MDEIDIWKNIADASDRKFVTMNESGKEVMDADNYHGRPVLGKIVVLPRSAAQDIAPDKPWALIGITDTGAPPIELKDEENLIDNIHLAFDDVEFQYAKMVSMVPINEGQAQSIADFVAKNWDKAELMVVHCNAGISRSSAVGKAISEVYQPDYAHYFDDFYSPNLAVYQTVMGVLNSTND
tara:strand:+ start:438 stop:980 length:543 start_codon:yes stop_codon:yes gene_type:complete